MLASYFEDTLNHTITLTLYMKLPHTRSSSTEGNDSPVQESDYLSGNIQEDNHVV